MLPWLAISEAVGRAPNVILEHRNFVKKLVFPVEILPVNLVFSGVALEMLALVIYLFFLMATREYIPTRALALPVLLVPQILITMGVCWAWAALGLFARDLAQVNGFLLTLVFFLTPICYPVEKLPPSAAAILQNFPLYQLVTDYRLLFISPVRPDWAMTGRLWLLGLAVFYCGYGVFRKLRPSFPDVL
jgi:lipopolysaccharide transport system permease protein